MGGYLAASSLGYALSLWLSSALIVASGWRAALIACAFGPVAASLLAAWVLRGTRNVVHPAGYSNPLRALLDVWRNKPRDACGLGLCVSFLGAAGHVGMDADLPRRGIGARP